MLHDESVYSDAFAFKPERWKDTTRAEFDKHPLNVAFGYGRRYVSSFTTCYLQSNT